MTDAAARLQAVDALVKRFDSLNLQKLVAAIGAAVKHPTASGVIEALEEGAADGAAIAALIPGGAAVAAELGLAATVLGLLDEAVKLTALAPDFGARLASAGVHVPALIAVRHGPVKPIFGENDGPERVFGFVPDP
ncbi:hypothetical protein [Rhodoblastus acidophilus]|nr:hypothetical protein [Rhodoblastus acidophilus]PPQ40664.1 hypothetical protein CKO16_02730 [Rhodoblastus acidophilus]RAI16229.1 hypothetical protein CH337_22490 [Rhodoblastus acidophilus]